MYFKKIFTCTFISLILSFLLICVFSVFVFFLNIPDRTVSLVISVLSALAVFFSAFMLAKNIPQKGLLHGLLLAGCYFAVLLTISLAMGKVHAEMSNFSRIAVILFSGMLGGILGINGGDKEET